MGVEADDNFLVRAAKTVAWRRLVNREAAYLRDKPGSAGTIGWGAVTLSQLFERHEPQAFFVLGNGESVNHLDERQFQFIGRHFSVGLNAWPLHPFVPSAYAFELYKLLGRDETEFEFLVGLAHKKALLANAEMLLLRPPPSSFDRLERLCANLPGLRFTMYGRANLAIESPGRLDLELKQSLAFLSSAATRSGVLLDNGSSVVRMVSLALLQGFKRIVLVGVDLNDGDYFWHNDEFVQRHGDFRDAVRRQPGEGRDTLSTESRPFSAADFLYALNRVAQSEYGAEIYVASSSSTLSEGLETFRFDGA